MRVQIPLLALDGITEARLQYQIVDNEGLEKKAVITITADEIEQGIVNQIDKIGKSIRLPGFRKGKVPKSIIRSRFALDLKSRAISDAADDAFRRILTDNNWHPASQAEMFDAREEDDLQFSLRFEILPDINLADYCNLEVFREDNLPDAYLMEKAVKQLMDEHSSIKEVNRPAVVDDFVTIDLDIIMNNKLEKNEAGIAIRIGDRSLPDELNRALVGITKNAWKEIKIESAVYRFTVKKVEEKTFPLINDAFAQKMKFANLEAMRKDLLEQAKKDEDRRVEDEIKESLSNILLERNRFPIPKSFVDREYKRILEQLEQTDSESNRERFQPLAEKRARLDLILSKIAELENIKIPEVDIKKIIAAMQWKLPEENRIKAVEYFRQLMTREKTLDFVYRKAKINRKSRIVSPKEALHDHNSVRH